MVQFQFQFPDLPAEVRDWWLVITPGEADVCDSDPGYPVAVTLTATLRHMTQLWRGDLSWPEALRTGAMEVRGPEELRRARPRLVPAIAVRHCAPAEDERSTALPGRFPGQRRKTSTVMPGHTPTARSDTRCLCSGKGPGSLLRTTPLHRTAPAHRTTRSVRFWYGRAHDPRLPGRAAAGVAAHFLGRSAGLSLRMVLCVSSW